MAREGDRIVLDGRSKYPIVVPERKHGVFAMDRRHDGDTEVDQAAQPPPAVERLLRLLRDRLTLMHDVARSKWNAGRPVRDPAREEALLREMESKGRDLGLAPALTRAFFTAQIDATISSARLNGTGS